MSRSSIANRTRSEVVFKRMAAPAARGLVAAAALAAAVVCGVAAADGRDAVSRTSLPERLQRALERVEGFCGTRVTIVSGFRDGATFPCGHTPSGRCRSYHADNKAVGFTTPARGCALRLVLQNWNVGVLTYRADPHIHIDLGPRVRNRRGPDLYAGRAVPTGRAGVAARVVPPSARAALPYAPVTP